MQCIPKKNKARCKISRGSATADHQFAYFTPEGSHSVFSYEWNTDNWKRLPYSLYKDSALVIINGELTTVGGRSKDDDGTNQLLTLRQRQWVEEYPPMNTARSDATAVSTSDSGYIIVIGDDSAGELFHVKTRQWYELPDYYLRYPSATICGNQVHVIGEDDGYSCSLQVLPSSDEPITPQSIPDIVSWTSLPPPPVEYSTAATLCGQLVIIGGIRDESPVNSIHQLVDGQWVEIGSMTVRRRFCLAVSPSPDRVIIVGGDDEERSSVEECVVEFIK